MASLKEIAEEVGVSVRTVSRALKENGYVRADIKARVNEVAVRVGYRPNAAAVRLRTGRSRVMTVLLTDTDELQIARVGGFEEKLRAVGYTVDVLFFHPEAGAADVLTELMQRQPAGLFLPSGSFFDSLQELVPAMQEGDTPLVAFDQPQLGCDSVLLNRQDGVYAAVGHLLATGREQIAYLGWRKDESRLAGYRRALAEVGRAPWVIDPSAWRDDAGEPLRFGNQFAWGREAGRRIAREAEKPDAIQCYADIVAMGLLAGLQDSGLRVPEDIAIIGFDDRSHAACAAPPLTTLAHPSREIGIAAAEILLERIAGEARASRLERRLPMTLIKRESA